MASILMQDQEGKLPPQYVNSEADGKALGPRWKANRYVHQPYPKWLYKPDGSSLLAADEAAHEAAAAQGWGTTHCLPPEPVAATETAVGAHTERRLLELEVAALRAKSEKMAGGDAAAPQAEDPAPAPKTKADKLAERQAEALARHGG